MESVLTQEEKIVVRKVSKVVDRIYLIYMTIMLTLIFLIV